MNEASDTLPTEAAQYALYITDESRAKAVGLRYDGSVEFRGVTPDEASRLFWDSMGREMIVRAAVLTRAAVPAVQPKVYKAGDLHFDSDVCLASQVLAAPQAEARQEQPKQPDSVYLTSSSGEAATARDALHDAATSLETIASLAGRKTYGSPPIETYMDTFMDVRLYAKARANVAREALAALSSTPAQGDAEGVPALNWYELHRWYWNDYLPAMQAGQPVPPLPAARGVALPPAPEPGEPVAVVVRTGVIQPLGRMPEVPPNTPLYLHPHGVQPSDGGQKE